MPAAERFITGINKRTVFKKMLFLPKSMLAKHIAMIRRNHNDGIRQKTRLFERLHQSAHHLVTRQEERSSWPQAPLTLHNSSSCLELDRRPTLTPSASNPSLNTPMLGNICKII